LRSLKGFFKSATSRQIKKNKQKTQKFDIIKNMKFLLVLAPKEKDWRDTLEFNLKRKGGEVTSVESVAGAQKLLTDPELHFDHILSGTMDDEWKKVRDTAGEGNSKMTLVTGKAQEIRQEARELNVSIIEKDNFDRT